MCAEAAWEDCCGHKERLVQVNLKICQRDYPCDAVEQHAWCVCVCVWGGGGGGGGGPAVNCMHVSGG